VLYDIDQEAVGKATSLGMTLHRTRMPNATPELIAVLDAIVAGAEQAPSLAGPTVAA
jgi:protoheme ferro-lyase